MTRDPHPEELIDRAMRGAIGAEERVALKRHMDSCAVCAEQVALARRFQRELAAQPRDQLICRRAAEAAIRRMLRSWRARRPR